MALAIDHNLTGKRRTKAIRSKQRAIIKAALKDVRDRVLAKVNDMPEEWDGFELRWVLAKAVDHIVMHPDNKRRRREFENECLIRNLP